MSVAPVFMELAKSLTNPAPADQPAPKEQEELAAAPVAADATDEDAQKNAPEEDKAEQGGNEDDKPLEQSFPVMIDGQEVQVPLSELLAGHQRHSDYTKKVMAVSEDRKAVEAEKAEVTKARTQYQELLNALEDAQKPNLPTSEQMNAALREGRTADYLMMQQAHQHWHAIQGEKQRVQQEADLERAKARKALEATERDKLLEALPEWRKDHHGQARVAKYLNDLGYSDDDLAEVLDHRHFLIAEKARRWDELQAKKPDALQKVANTPPVVRPGARQDAKVGQQAKIADASARLAKSGSEKDLRAVFSEMFK